MSITGIISEYNPFHNGHKYLIEARKKNNPNSYFIAVMSGNFTQRGEIAILDKWERAKLAVANGIDLVLELPFVFAIRSAEFFAKGGVDLLQKLNCVDTICFGSEYTNNAQLQFIAQMASSTQFKNLLTQNLSSGKSYAAITSTILSQLTNISEDILKAPNTILGIEYLKANATYPHPFAIDIIKRLKAEHNDVNYQDNFASGTAIRHSVYTHNNNFSKLKQVVPLATFNALQKKYNQHQLPNLNYLFTNLITKLRLAKLHELTPIYGIREGLEYKLLQVATEATSLTDLTYKLKSKRYPLTNIQRLILYLLLNITKDDINKFDSTGALYARVLAFNRNGTKLLKQLKKTSAIPIITKTTTILDSKQRYQQQSLTTLEEMLSIDTYASELYNLCFAQIRSYGQDFTTSPYYHHD